MKKWLSILFFLSTFFTASAYKYGDVVTNSDGSKGLVFWLSPDASYGWMVALEDAPVTAQWGDTVDIPEVENITFYLSYADTAGYVNTQILLNVYPSASYAANYVDFANGWYLPSTTQLATIFTNLPMLEPLLVLNGGTTLGEAIYWSASEFDKYFAVGLNFVDGIAYGYPKPGAYSVRQVRTFVNQSFQYDLSLSYVWNTGDTTAFIKVSPAASTLYAVTAKNDVGCEAYAEKTIFVGDNQTEEIYATICEGESYTQYGFNESLSGTYQQVVSGSNACALTINLHLTVFPQKETVLFDTVTVGNEYLNHGFYYSYIDTPGDILDSLTYNTSNSCDSLVILNLHVLPVYKGLVYDTICQGYPYVGYGFNLPIQKYLGKFTYALHLKTENGCCDSISELHLQVYPASFSYTDATICEGEEVLFNGVQYTKAGVYAAYLTNHRGCDSIASLRLFTFKATSSITKDSICEGESYVFNGVTYTETGIYESYFNNDVGCDSIAYLDLFVKPHSASVSYITICEGESYSFNGIDYSLAGTYQSTLVNALNCDSIATLVLQISKPEPTYLYETINDGDIYDFYGNDLTVSGVYQDTLASFWNCDSVIILHLSVKKIIIVPEVFSPNSDGVNDLLVIKNIEQYPTNKIFVFNRWGNKVWEGGPYLNNWDGSCNTGFTIGGKELPVGTYFYIIDLGDGSEVQKGFVYLNR